MRIGIVGYGNLGKAVEKIAKQNKDIEIVGIFSRRKIHASVPTFDINQASDFKGKIDIMFMCGGSEKDLMIQTPTFAKDFNTIDTFDTHKNISKHFKNVDKICKENHTSSIVCCGWDPGLFSCLRVLFGSIFENVNCFFGKGVSLGHTNALKRIRGVVDAKQITIPNKKCLKKAKQGKEILENKHIRKCFVVTNQNRKIIKEKIQETPNYFKGEKTIVKFVKQSHMKKFENLSHKGQIICKSKNDSLSLSLEMKRNPEFTAKIMIAFATALEKIIKANVFGAFTPLQIPVSWLTKTSKIETLKKFC